MVGRVAPLVLVADSTALGVWTYLARVLLEEYTWQCSCSSVFCHGGKGSPSGALCRRSSSTVHRSIYYQTLLSVLCYHLDSLVCLFVVFMFHPVTQGNENQSISDKWQRWRVYVLSPINGACRAHPLTKGTLISEQTFIDNRLEAVKCYADLFKLTRPVAARHVQVAGGTKMLTTESYSPVMVGWVAPSVYMLSTAMGRAKTEVMPRHLQATFWPVWVAEERCIQDCLQYDFAPIMCT